MLKKLTFFCVAAYLGFVCPAFASDHIDNPAHEGRNVDISDLFAWMPEERKLVVAVNVHHEADHHSHFDKNAIYRFRIRQIKLNHENAVLRVPQLVKGSPELEIACQVAKPFKVNCKVSNHPDIKVSNLKTFAGHRADPFILNAEWAMAAVKATFSPLNGLWNNVPAVGDKAVNFSDKNAILNLTLEMNIENAGLLAVAAEVEKNKVRVDRIGRPEITNMTIRPGIPIPLIGREDIREQYNKVGTFEVQKSNKFKKFKKFIKDGITDWDGLDGKNNWNKKLKNLFVNLLVNDYLVVNTEKVCEFSKPSYLDIERGIGNNCGGRTPNDDIIDSIVSIYIAGPFAAIDTYGDGVSKTINNPKAEFPYFAEPHPEALKPH